MPNLTKRFRAECERYGVLLENGNLPAYAWPGGYPLLYSSHIPGEGTQGEYTLCPDCANATRQGEDESPDGFADVVSGYFVHYEGPPAQCDHCYTLIGSAYGDPDDPCPDCGEPDCEHYQGITPGDCPAKKGGE